jgi:hypothetical protein
VRFAQNDKVGGGSDNDKVGVFASQKISRLRSK